MCQGFENEAVIKLGGFDLYNGVHVRDKTHHLQWLETLVKG